MCCQLINLSLSYLPPIYLKNLPHLAKHLAISLTKVADPHHFRADPDPYIHFNGDLPSRLFTSMRMRKRIRSLLLIKVMRVYDHWSTSLSGLHYKPPRLYCERPSPPWLHSAPLKFLNLDYNADLDKLAKIMWICAQSCLKLKGLVACCHSFYLFLH